jgi:RNA polymerase sigma factor (sigma-70 family)
MAQTEKDMTDHEVIRRVLDGDQAAYRLLLERYRSYVYQAAFSVLREPLYAEDAAQEAFVKIYYALPQYEYQGFKTWLTRIVVNHSIDYRRKLQRRREQPVDWSADEAAAGQAGAAFAAAAVIHASGPPTEADVLRRLEAEELRSRLGTMPGTYREVVSAYYFDELTCQEIADRQGSSVRTVESQLYRARIWMRKHWKEEDFR